MSTAIARPVAIFTPRALTPRHLSLPLLPTLAALLFAAALQASAVSFDFYKLGRGVVNGDFLPDGTAGVDYHVIAGDNVSSRVDLGIFGETSNSQSAD